MTPEQLQRLQAARAAYFADPDNVAQAVRLARKTKARKRAKLKPPVTTP